MLSHIKYKTMGLAECFSKIFSFFLKKNSAGLLDKALIPAEN
jgi:hypothetical protein